MPYNEKLANRIREALSDQEKVEEKMMFRGMCFMVNGKMCVCVSADEMMCRIGPDHYDDALERNGCRPMIHNGKAMKGFVFVGEDALRTKKDFDHWINLSLDFNAKAKKARPKTRKTAKHTTRRKTSN
jgi:TfoX/Sxy family transcriptional regulator of competence genes